jgi:hypothetical protein
MEQWCRSYLTKKMSDVNMVYQAQLLAPSIHDRLAIRARASMQIPYSHERAKRSREVFQD